MALLWLRISGQMSRWLSKFRVPFGPPRTKVSMSKGDPKHGGFPFVLVHRGKTGTFRSTCVGISYILMDRTGAKADGADRYFLAELGPSITSFSFVANYFLGLNASVAGLMCRPGGRHVMVTVMVMIVILTCYNCHSCVLCKLA